MSDEQFIQKFEAGDLAPDKFHHSDHVRLAFAYLTQFAALEALIRFSQALKHFAAAHGKEERYNETITYAYFFLIRERMARRQYAGFEEFATANADLFKWSEGVLGRYYNESTLKSDFARRVFVWPDK
jgi:hypothetical protein